MDYTDVHFVQLARLKDRLKVLSIVPSAPPSTVVIVSGSSNKHARGKASLWGIIALIHFVIIEALFKQFDFPQHVPLAQV
jgi:hypothetical protein